MLNIISAIPKKKKKPLNDEKKDPVICNGQNNIKNAVKYSIEFLFPSFIETRNLTSI